MPLDIRAPNADNDLARGRQHAAIGEKLRGHDEMLEGLETGLERVQFAGTVVSFLNLGGGLVVVGIRHGVLEVCKSSCKIAAGMAVGAAVGTGIAYGLEAIDAPPEVQTAIQIGANVLTLYLLKRPVGFNPGNFVGKQAVTSPHLPAGKYPALVINGKVYVGRMHIVAWELAGKK